MDRLTALAKSALETWRGLSLLQQGLIGALGLVVAYLAMEAALRSARRVALAALLVVAGVAIVRLMLPESFCAVRWPSPIAALCSR